jgi:hypothetical protein
VPGQVFYYIFKTHQNKDFFFGVYMNWLGAPSFVLFPSGAPGIYRPGPMTYESCETEKASVRLFEDGKYSFFCFWANPWDSCGLHLILLRKACTAKTGGGRRREIAQVLSREFVLQVASRGLLHEMTMSAVLILHLPSLKQTICILGPK